MSRRHYGLPPLTTLSAFEAAARHLSFKDAAQELSVTPGAVSHQIKALEAELNVSLFRRKHRGVELTREGLGLYQALSTSFRQISRELAKIRQDGESNAVKVGSTTAVAALWLSPALIHFWREYPDLNVHQITQDRPFQNTRDYDFFISYGRNADSSLQQTPIYRDRLVPVATPETAKQLADCSLSHLAKQRLIHLDSANQSWTTWAEWFQQLGYTGKTSEGTRVTSYSVALQLSQKGAGIALGWKRLIQPMLDNGKLVVVGNHSLPAPKEFFLAGLPDEELSPNALKLKDWILTEATQPSV
ncbi:LysR substrate-binding domain-containing protein [Actibacterium pelagium]|uniref:LysR family transcriptional regulator n=1 Tax=Actibacterium pelagium TaxID=2029103 RepID=A0A917AMK2_9RHOB|nr:LysR substrate-binding domain-containing protein [Actibacterium pelagium]GGE61768.1 LysR family transcriptional regulator [Actibacterium pelagium]